MNEQEEKYTFNMSVPCEMLLHPELISSDQIISILEERQLRIHNVRCLPRDELLELFHNYCVPYGQRKYKDTGRGKLLNKSRNLSPDIVPKLNLVNHHQLHTTSVVVPSNCERLKPPPDLLSGHMKRIKLESLCVNSINEDNILKRKMSIDLAETPSPKKGKKLITWP